MKKGQTSVRGGIQDILIPMEFFRCLQGDFEGNHPSYACDMSGKDTGRDLCFAPCDVVCVATNPNDGNTVWWQSQNKVRFADGTIDYLAMMIIHDNNLDGIYIGAKYSQGQQIAQEGTAGMANGNHLHIEFAKGKLTSKYAKNAKGYYLPNSIAIETVCFADGTTFMTSSNWGWKYTKDVPVTSASKPSAITGSSAKYGVGTLVCTNTLATSSAGGKVYKGDWSGKITRVIPGAPYPYLLNDGTGWTNDAGIDSDPHTPR